MIFRRIFRDGHLATVEAVRAASRDPKRQENGFDANLLRIRKEKKTPAGLTQDRALTARND
jgi:hypothetical protein